jgi:hypothetical protein
MIEGRPRRVSAGDGGRGGVGNLQSPPRTRRTQMRRRTSMARWQELAVIAAGLGIFIVAVLIVTLNAS